MVQIRVKVCCMASAAEARLAAGLGADAVGLVGQMPSGPGVIGVAAAARIAREVPAGVDTFLLTSATGAQEIMQDLAVCPASAVQIVRHIDPRPGHEYSEQVVDVRVGGDMTGAYFSRANFENVGVVFSNFDDAHFQRSSWRGQYDYGFSTPRSTLS